MSNRAIDDTIHWDRARCRLETSGSSSWSEQLAESACFHCAQFTCGARAPLSTAASHDQYHRLKSHTTYIFATIHARLCEYLLVVVVVVFFFRLKCVLLCELAIAWRGPKSVWRSRSSLAINNQHPIRLLFVHDGVDYDIYTKGEYIDWNRSTLRLHLHCDTCKFTLT